MDPKKYPLTPEEAFDNTKPKGILIIPPNISEEEIRKFIEEWKNDNSTIIYRSPDKSVWLEKKGGKLIIHCPGEVKTIYSGLIVPDGVEIIAHSDYCAGKHDLVMKIEAVQEIDHIIDVQNFRKDQLHYKKQQEKLRARNFKRK